MRYCSQHCVCDVPVSCSVRTPADTVMTKVASVQCIYRLNSLIYIAIVSLNILFNNFKDFEEHEVY